jgi:subtilisin family serine protease
MRRLLATLGAAALALTAFSVTPSTGSAAPAPEADTASYLVVTDPAQTPTLMRVLPAAAASEAQVFSEVGTVVVNLTEDQAASLDSRPGVTISPNGPVKATETPNSWGQDRVNQRDLPLDDNWTAPDNGNVTGSGVDVYVIDTGIQPKADFTLGDGIDIVEPGTPPDECPGNPVPHGTHVAGTIGSSIYGLAPGVTLHAVRVLGCDNSGSWAGVIAGMNWVVQSANGGAAVANMSLGGFRNEAVNQATANMVSAGVTTAVSAGNDAADVFYTSPGSTPSAITAAASDRYDTRASFSNFGSLVDVYAPGVDIPSDNAFGDQPLVFSGTSMASPHVAGWAALYLSTDPENKSPAAVAAALVQGASGSKIIGNPSGTPDLLLYTDSIAPPDEPPPSDLPSSPYLSKRSVTSKSITLNWSPPDDDGGADIYAYRWGWVSANGKPVKRWTKIYDLPMARPFTMTNLSPNNTYSITLEAINENGIGEPTTINVRTAKAPATYPRPSAPRWVKGKPGNHAARISWSTPSRSRGVDKYQVRRYNGSSKYVGSRTFAVRFTHLKNARTYTFDVRAHSRGGWGPWSRAVRVRPNR